MSATDSVFARWVFQAQIAEHRLTAEQRGLLRAAFAFRQSSGDDYYSSRLLTHFLLHCDCGPKVAQIARLVGVGQPTASRQQGVSSKEAVQAAHHRMVSRPHGKMLPRNGGPIAEFILTHADATRFDILDFIHDAWGVRVSTVALFHFCKRFGLDRATRAAATALGRAQSACPPSRGRSKSFCRASPCPCRLPLFHDADAICGGVSC